MRTGAAAGHRGYFHETTFYGSDEELLAVVIPFVTGGLEAGEPTLVAFDDGHEALVRASLADSGGVTFLPGASQYSRPASAIRSYRRLLAEHTAAGAQQIRIVGDVPHPGVGVPWSSWARYEAAVNRAYDDFPLWGLCPYDTRITPDEVLDDVVRAHPRIATGERHEVNGRFEDPAGLLHRRGAARDRLEYRPAAVDLVDPTPAAARSAVLAVAPAAKELDAAEVSDMVFAVSEAVTNGICHGRGPVRLRVWAARDRIVATVTDAGAGPVDPLAGLLPASSTASAGIGLWIVHQTCSYVSLDRDDDGFTVRLVTGRPDIVS